MGNIKRWLLTKENQLSQGEECGAFLCMGSLKSFLWYAPQLSGACILYLHILSASGPAGSHWRPASAEDCDILCLLIWQETFHFPQAWGADSEKKSENLTRHVLWFTYRQYLYLTVLIEVLKSNQLVLLPSMYQFHPYHKINAYRIDLIHLNRIMIFKGNITEI